MMKTILAFVGIVLLCAFCMVMFSCDMIPGNAPESDPVLTNFSVEKTFKVDSLIMFNLNHKDTVDCAGTKACTVEVNNKVISTQQDSLYTRFSCQGQAFMTINDTVFGFAKFVKDDVLSWRVLLLRYLLSDQFLSKRVAACISQSEMAAIKACTSDVQLKESDKQLILNALNSNLDSLDMFYKYKSDLVFDIAFPAVLSQLSNQVRYLVDQSILLDTNGTLKQPLSAGEIEIMRWFNWAIFVQFIDNDIIASDYGKVFKRFSTKGRVFSMLFQHGPSQGLINEHTIERLFIQKSTGLEQLAYRDASGEHSPKARKIQDYPFMCDTSWTAAPLFRAPEVPFIDSIALASMILPGKGIMLYKGYSIDTLTHWYYTMKLYYPISGERLINDGNVLQVTGAILLTYKFLKEISTVTFNDNIYQGWLQGWESRTVVQGIEIDGTIHTFKESCLLTSDDAGRDQ